MGNHVHDILIVPEYGLKKGIYIRRIDRAVSRSYFRTDEDPAFTGRAAGIDSAHRDIDIRLFETRIYFFISIHHRLYILPIGLDLQGMGTDGSPEFGVF